MINRLFTSMGFTSIGFTSIGFTSIGFTSFNRSKRSVVRLVTWVFLSLAVTACGGGMSDLQDYVAEVKSRPGGRIEPLPQIKPYETFDYSVADMRSPFVQEGPGSDSSAPVGPAPVQNRNKEYLEQFPLDTLAMVGTLKRDGRTYGLVQTSDGLVHRVLAGNYLGQNDGQVTVISESRIEVEELVPNGIGSFFKRSAGIGLN